MKEDIIPQVLTLALNNIGGKEGKFHMIALLDTGGSGAINKTSSILKQFPMELKPGQHPIANGKFVTTAGTFESTQLLV